MKTLEVKCSGKPVLFNLDHVNVIGESHLSEMLSFVEMTNGEIYTVEISYEGLVKIIKKGGE